MTLSNAQLVPEIPDSTIGGGTCTGCGAGPRPNPPGIPGHERILATGWFVDFEGQVVFCETCVKFMASFFGLIDPDTAKVRTSDVRRAERRDKKVREAAENLRAAKGAADALSEGLAALADELGFSLEDES